MEHSILSFLLDYLSDMQIQYVLTEKNDITMSSLDQGLREQILQLTDTTPASVMKPLESNTLYHIIDYYNCNYSFFQFPNEEKFLFIGPYIVDDMTEASLNAMMSRLNIPSELFSQLQEYYQALPHISEKHSFYALLLRFYGTICNVEVPNARYVDLNELKSQVEFLRQQESQTVDDPISAMHLLEQLYSIEDTLLNAISQSNPAKALAAVDSFNALCPAPLFSDELQNLKNRSIILNTMLRRTAYDSGVHPFYIDAVTNNYVRLIEQSKTLDEVNTTIPFMIRSYCDLVSKRSLNAYSEPIRHILVTVDASLAADLSLKRFANELFLNTSYLSALFKKEMGTTLTDYVNKNRIAYAKKLLRSTTLPIQEIAAQAGISDIHYFTRLFRRETEMSPREWRNQ